MTFTERDFRDAMGTFATGVCIVTCAPNDKGQGPVGVTVNSFTSVSLTPPLVLWCLANDSDRFDAFHDATAFCVNILSESQKELSIRFAEDGSDFSRVDMEVWDTGAPVFTQALATLECAVDAVHEGGDHAILVGRATRVLMRSKAAPLVYYRGCYSGITGPEERPKSI